MTHTRESITAFLHQHHYEYELMEHAPMYTIEDMLAGGFAFKGEVIKNLFLRDNKGKRHFLVLLSTHKSAKLHDVERELDCGRLSFASEERLLKYLGITPGAVTPLAILSDEAGAVEVLCDREILEKEVVGVHPCENTATLWLKTADLIQIIQGSGHDLRYIAL